MSLPVVSLKTLNELGYQKDDKWEPTFHKGIHIRKTDTDDLQKPRYEVLIQLDKSNGKEHGWIKMHTSNETAAHNIDVNLLKEVAHAVLKRFKTSQGSDNLQRLSQITAEAGSLKARIQKNPTGKVSITTNDPAEHEFEKRTDARKRTKLENKNVLFVASEVLHQDEKLHRVRDQVFNKSAVVREQKEMKAEEPIADTMPLLPPKLDKEDHIANTSSRFGKINFQSIQDKFRMVGKYLNDGAAALKELTTIKGNTRQARSGSIFSYKGVITNSTNSILDNSKNKALVVVKTIARVPLNIIWMGAITAYKIPLGIAKMLTTTTLSRDWNKLQTVRYNLDTSKLDKAKAFTRFALRSMPLSFIARQIAKGIVTNNIKAVEKYKKIVREGSSPIDIQKAFFMTTRRIALNATLITPLINIMRPTLKHMTRLAAAPFIDLITDGMARPGNSAKNYFVAIMNNSTMKQTKRLNETQQAAKENAQKAKQAYYASKNPRSNSGVREA